MEVIVTIVSKLVDFTYLGDVSNLLLSTMDIQVGGGNSNTVIVYVHP